MSADIDMVLRRGVDECPLSLQILEQFRTPLVANDLTNLARVVSDDCSGQPTIAYLLHQLTNDFIDCKDSIRVLVVSFSDGLKP